VNRWQPAMVQAVAEARRALAHGDVPIAAIVLDSDGELIAAAHNERELNADPTAHAEVLALRRAAKALGSWHLEDCTLVVTVEPCTMCAGALVAARLGRLVFGAYDPKAGAVASLWDVVRDPRLNHRVEVIGGIAEAECAAVLQEFFADRR
jgi:tRNA(adenine34) deaminase